MMGKFRLAIIVFILSTMQLVHAVSAPIVDYRLDECYFLSGANGVSGDVANNTGSTYDATSVNRIDSDQTASKICRSGAFSDNSYAVVDTAFTLGNQWTMSVWINFPFVQTGKQYYILGSYGGSGDLPVFEYQNTTLRWGIYDNSGALMWNSIDNTLTGWHHLTFVNNGGNTTLYVDSISKNTVPLGTSGDVSYLWTSSDDLVGQSIASSIDEMKIFGSVLTSAEITSIYNNENAGKNYDGTLRDCPSCESAPIAAHTWEYIGIPAESRNVALTVSDVFKDDMQGVFNTDWRVYKRTYSTTSNASQYEQMTLDSVLDFGAGYLLGSSLDARWDVDGTTPVDYNSTHEACTASACVEIDLTSVTLNFAVDGNDGTGPYRYNLSGFTGLSKPVQWADCRFIISDTDGNNEEVLTPTGAETADYAAKQIWLYNSDKSGADSNGYITCDDTSPGGCILLPFNGFWVELHGKTKGKTVKLLIPKE